MDTTTEDTTVDKPWKQGEGLEGELAKVSSLPGPNRISTLNEIVTAILLGDNLSPTLLLEIKLMGPLTHRSSLNAWAWFTDGSN